MHATVLFIYLQKKCERKRNIINYHIRFPIYYQFYSCEYMMRKGVVLTQKPARKIMSHQSSEDCNLNSSEYQLCCCCLELVCLKSLWSQYVWMGRNEVYGDMLKECFNLTWPEPNMKEQICEVCITQLRNALHFKRKVMQCQATIRSQHIEYVTKMATVTAISNDNRLNDNFDDLDTEDNYDDSTSLKLEDVVEVKSTVLEDYLKDVPDKKTVKPKITDTKKSKRKQVYQPKKRDKVDGRKANYVKARQNVCLILENSTILPFKSNKGYFNCLYCNKQFVCVQELKSHVDKLHENISFKTILKSILRPKDRIRADVSDIKCRICKKKLDNLEILIKHLTDDHSVVFNDCIKPNECFLAYDLGDGKFKCYECKAEFLFFKTLSKHMNEHSTDYVCDVCGRCFLLPERLRAHTQLHNIEKPVKCDICGKICTSNILLKSHIRYTHKKLSFLCAICDKTFPSYRTKMRHLEEVHNRAPLNLTCKLCSKKFATPNSLNSHMRSDHLKPPKEPKYGCNTCGMMFKSRHALSYHSIVHSGEKNYECKVCHKKYARAKTLTEHIKIHLNDKRWSCGSCSQAFIQKCSLKNHIRVHHGDVDCDKLIVYKKPDDK